MTSMTVHIVTRITRNKCSLLKLFTISILFILAIYVILPTNRIITTYQPPKRPLDPVYANLFTKLNPVVPGWGENGQAIVLSELEEKLAEKEFSKAAFNVYASDRIR